MTDREELLVVYMMGFNDELDGRFLEDKEWGTTEKNSAYQIGKFHAICGDDVSSIDEMSEDEIIIEIIEHHEKN